jgi:K+-sensing histidine kinase KdpD
LNQRAIQKQIDGLLENNTINERYQDEMQREFHDLLKVGSNALSEINRIVANKRQLLQPINELEYTLGMSQLLVDKSRLLEQLEKGHYKIQKKRKELSSILLPIMDIFNCIKAEKNIELFEKIPHSTYVNCDEKLLTTLFSCLYKNALEAALRGSKVSVTSEIHQDFVLITMHNVGVIPENIIDTFTERFESDENKRGAGIGVYLAYLAIDALNGELYYHSSPKFGTFFYIKVPT